MGLYAIPCRQCGQVFMWFSGNLDQRCSECTKQRPLTAEERAALDRALNRSVTVIDAGYEHQVGDEP